MGRGGDSSGGGVGRGGGCGQWRSQQTHGRVLVWMLFNAQSVYSVHLPERIDQIDASSL